MSCTAYSPKKDSAVRLLASILILMMQVYAFESFAAENELVIKANDERVSVGSSAAFASVPEQVFAEYFGGVSDVWMANDRAELQRSLAEIFDDADERLSWQRPEQHQFGIDADSRFNVFRFKVRLDADKPRDYLVNLNGIHGVAWRYVDEGDVASGDATWHIDDFRESKAGRPIFHPVPAIPVSFVPGATYSFEVIGYTITPQALVSIELLTEEAFLKFRTYQYLIDGAYYGLIVTLVVGNLFFLILLREALYLYFSLFLLASAGTIYIGSGLSIIVGVENRLTLSLPLVYLSIGLVGLFSALFSMRLLNINRRTPRLRQLWLGVCGVYLVSTPLILFFTRSGGFDLQQISLGIAIAVLAGIFAQITYLITLFEYWHRSYTARFWFVSITMHNLVLFAWPVLLNTPVVLVVEPYNLAQFWLSVDMVMLSALIANNFRTEQQARREAQRKSMENLRLAHGLEKTKSNFVATVGHDLRGPVQAIRHFAYSLKAKAPEALHGELTKIDDSVDTIAGLLDGMVQLSEIEYQSASPSMNTFNLAGLLAEVAGEFNVKAAEKQLILELIADDCMVLGNRVLLSQVLRNLIDNAIKYTDAGRVSIVLRDEADTAVIQIEDTGRGISSADREKMFDEFYRVHGGYEEGVGLGLSIVKRLSDLLDIEIDVHSVVGEGTRFELAMMKFDSSQTPVPEGDLPAVLVISSELTEPALAMLMSWKCSVHEVSSAEDALDYLLQGTTPDLIVLGVEDYRALAALMKKIPQINQHLPFVVLTTADADVREGDNVFSVPASVSPMQLRSLLRRQLAIQV